MEYNSTTGPAPSNCTGFGYDITAVQNITGALSIPGVVSVAQASFHGQHPSSYWNQTELPLNLTSLDLPDLVTVGDGFDFDWADKLSSLSVPKLTHVGYGLSFNLSGEDPPAINLSFPSLYYAEGIFLTGNIDA